MFVLFQRKSRRQTIRDKIGDNLYNFGETSAFHSKYKFWISLIPMKWNYWDYFNKLGGEIKNNLYISMFTAQKICS